jgi:hypothetical protein
MKQLEVKDCTKENPMPYGYEIDKSKERYVHHDVTELEDLDMMGIEYKCNSCGLIFIARF